MDTQGDLEKIKKQLNHGGDHFVLQGPLLKRSDTIRKWNSRWFTLDVSTVKLEYRSQRGDTSPRGVVNFDADSTIAICSQNIMKERKYDGCCFYIRTSQKKDYFCAETQEAARAWVATLRAAMSVHEAQREAVNLLSGNGQAKMATVASVVAAANATAKEAGESLQLSMNSAALAASSSQKKSKQTGPIMGDFELMQETIRVKEEEIHQLAMDLKSRDCTINELSDRLIESADTTESSAAAVRGADKECKQALSEVDHLRKQLVQAVQKIRVADAQVTAALKVEETALHEAHRCRLELGKLRERGVILEGAMMRVEEDIRRLKVAHEHEITERLQPQPARVESRLPVEEVPCEDTPGGAEEIALEKPTRRAPPEGGEFMAPKATQDIASTSESSAAVGASEENTAPMLTCENLLTHDATTLFKTDITGMDLIANDPGPSEGVPLTRDEISLFQLETANACIHENLDLKHSTASDVLISEDAEKKIQAAYLAEPLDESPKESEFYPSSHNDGEDNKDGEEEKEIDVYCGKTGDILLEGAEESHAAEECHELVTSYQSSHEETVTIEEEPHRREAHFRLCCF